MTTTTDTTTVVSTEATDTTVVEAPKPSALIAQHPDVVAAAAALKEAKAKAKAALKPASEPKAPARKRSDAINFDAKEVFGVESLGRFVRAETVEGSALPSGLFFVKAYSGTRGRNGNGTLTLCDGEMGEFQIDWRTVLDDAHNGANPSLLSLEIVTGLPEIAGFFGVTLVESVPVEVSAPSVTVEVESEESAPVEVSAPESTLALD